MKADIERTGVQEHVHLDISGKKKKEKGKNKKHSAKMSNRYLTLYVERGTRLYVSQMLLLL